MMDDDWDNVWPDSMDFSGPWSALRDMTPEERKRSLERAAKNSTNKCVSCGNTSAGDFCDFCLNEE
jgi:hypothetical protein